MSWRRSESDALDTRAALIALLKLYHPNVRGGPNFAPANVHRGENQMLAKVILALGLQTEDETARDFKRLDDAHAARTEAVLARVNAEHRSRATGNAGTCAWCRRPLIVSGGYLLCGCSSSSTETLPPRVDSGTQEGIQNPHGEVEK